MSEFKIGSDVQARDGRLGRVAQVVLDRHTGEVTDLVVALQGDDVSVVLPRSAVARWDDASVTLDIDGADLAQQPVFRATQFEACGPAGSSFPEGKALYWLRRYGVRSGSQPALASAVTRQWVRTWPKALSAVGRGTPVRVHGAVVAQVDHVLVDAQSGEMTHLVLAPSDAGGAAPVVPADMVTAADDEGIDLGLEPAEWESLTRYAPRPDEAIAAEVRQELAAVGCRLDEVEVSVDRGVVAVRGPAHVMEVKRAADQALRRVEGVVGVENLLTVDSGVRAAVSAALASDSRTGLSDIEVVALRGTVTLRGGVAGVDEARAAEEIARGVEGVQMVLNELEVDRRTGPERGGASGIDPQQWRAMAHLRQ